MSDDNPYVIPDMEPTLRKQIQECNWQIVNATTPANYFHVLRRQVSLLIVFSYFKGLFPILQCLNVSHGAATQRFPEAFDCNGTKELAPSQGLQIKSL